MQHKAITAWGMGLFTLAGMLLSSGQPPVSAKKPGVRGMIEIPRVCADGTCGDSHRLVRGNESFRPRRRGRAGARCRVTSALRS